MKNKGGIIKKTKRLMLFLSICFLVFAGFSNSAPAQPINSTFGTPFINGTLAEFEWEGAGQGTFVANTPGGGTENATIYVMNDLNNLYIAIYIPHAEPNDQDENSASISFDNIISLSEPIIESGDDKITINPKNSPLFSDAVYDDTSCTQPLCYFSDLIFAYGTNDGEGAFSNGNGYTIYEFSHPLCSSDNAHDFCLSGGDSVGFTVTLKFLHYSPYGEAITDWPASSGPLVASEYGKIVIASSPGTSGTSCVYIYKDDATGADDFKTFLDGQTACTSTDILDLDNTIFLSHIDKDLIIIGSDSGYLSNWGDKKTWSIIRDSGKPVLGIGEGGYAFFGKLGLEIGYPHGAHWSASSTINSVHVVRPAHQIFSGIIMPLDQNIDLYFSTGGVGIYAPDPIPTSIKEFGDLTSEACALCDNVHFPIIQEGARYFLWGFTGNPTSMTPDDGVTLFSNVVNYLLGSAAPCADTDEDTICNSVDNCPNISNTTQTDVDEDGLGDVCDPCDDIDNDGLGVGNTDTCATDLCPYDHLPVGQTVHLDTDDDGVGDDCDNCPDVPNSGQEDENQDERGDVCQQLEVTLTGPFDDPTALFKPNQPLWTTFKVVNLEDQPQQIIKPTCFSCGAGPLFTVEKDGKALRQKYRIGPPIVVPNDVITIAGNGFHEIECDISGMFTDELKDSVPTDGVAEVFNIYGTLRNAIVDEESGLKPYVYSSTKQELLIEGEAVDIYSARSTFLPDQWYAHWAVAGGPEVTATVTFADTAFNAANVVESSITLNGSVPIVPLSYSASGNSLTVKFKGDLAVASFGSMAAVTVNATIQGEVNDGGYFTATGVVRLHGNAKIIADRHVVGCGSHPGSTKYRIPSMNTYVYDKGPGSCAAGYGTSWHHWPDIRDNCTPLTVGITTYNGIAEFVLPAGNWLLIAEYDPAVFDIAGEKQLIGRPLGDFTGHEVVEKYCQVIEKCDKKTVPGKSKKLTGSELWIIEPEYVEWSGESEYYPFVFESVGDWSVTTSIEPPEGFVLDNDSLSENVDNGLKALQFTMTDVGTKWKSSKVKHKIKHKGKTKKIESMIGIKLKPKLAKKKGVGIYGDEKIKTKDKNK